MKKILQGVLLLLVFLNITTDGITWNTHKAGYVYHPKPIVTIIELGSVKCIPCKKMQVVLKSIDEKYGNSVKTIFYDVWTKSGVKYADLYKVDLIPVQVFLDANGNEFFRHEGFFSEEEIVKVLNTKGVKPNSIN